MTAFCQTLHINDYAVHRIADSEKGDVADQEYFIVRIESYVRKITAPNETFGTNDFKRGSFVVQVRWLEFQSADGYGNRLYSLGGLIATSCLSFVRNLTRPITLDYDSGTKLFRLDQTLDAHILHYAILSED